MLFFVCLAEFKCLSVLVLSVVTGVFVFAWRNTSSASQVILPDKRSFNDDRSIES